MQFFLFLPMLFSISSSLFVTMENKKIYCFYKTLNKTETLGITYIVSGSGQKNLYEIISSIKIDKLFTKTDVSEFNYVFKPSKEKQEIKICFENTDSNKKNLQFDFVLDSDKNYELATKNDMVGLQMDLKKGQRKLQKIYKNQQFQQVRDETHSKKMLKTETRVKWASIIKISASIVICIAQIYVLTGLFKNKSVGSV